MNIAAWRYHQWVSILLNTIVKSGADAKHRYCICKTSGTDV